MLICPGLVAAYWDVDSVREKYCWSPTKFLYAMCWSDVGADLIVLLMPIPSVMLKRTCLVMPSLPYFWVPSHLELIHHKKIYPINCFSCSKFDLTSTCKPPWMKVLCLNWRSRIPRSYIYYPTRKKVAVAAVFGIGVLFVPSKALLNNF
jgi:hypothetical protein